MKGIGLFGGTFNPLHNGHLRVAEDVRTGFNLEKILFIPAAIPPHKDMGNLADAMDRFRMIQGEIRRHPGFGLSDVEVRRTGPSYTIDTVRHFLDQGDGPWYLMVGTDAFFEIDTWKSWQRLFDLIPLILMTRPAAEGKAPPVAALEAYLRDRVDPAYHWVAGESGFLHPRKQPVYVQPVPLVDISSTQIRDRLGRGLSIQGLVPDFVETYIKEKGLYK